MKAGVIRVKIQTTVDPDTLAFFQGIAAARGVSIGQALDIAAGTPNGGTQ